MNKTNNQTNNVRRLFQAIDVKPMIATDKLDPISSKDSNTNIGQELTGGKTLERSIRNRNFILYVQKNSLLISLRCTSSYHYGFLSS
jgi:hypothetical protein